ncbi:MAG: ATP-binding cassette domain-containing protein [Acidobacteria bacterium]|nr:ATP-binding cassette domain-containing protein [Acidobacteriota bacterium]
MVLELKSIRKCFGKVAAVDGVSFSVEKGTIYGLLGPNGAGKTTTIRMIMSILLPDEGEVRVLGNGIGAAVRDRMGYLPEERGLYRKMKILDMLVFFGRSHGLGTADAKKRAAEWLKKMELPGVQRKKVEELSKGMQQKVQFIAAVLHAPDLLVLDEPFSGLDPINTQVLKDAVLEMNRNGTTVIFSTHNMEEAEKMCNAICLINHGKAVVSGPLGDIKRGYGKRSIIVEGTGELAKVRDLDYVEKIDLYENYAEVRLKAGESPQRLLKDLVGVLDIRKFEVVEPTLRNIFIDLVSGGEREHQGV